MEPAAADRAQLEDIRKRLAVWSLKMTTAAKSGHPSSCLSASHVVTALYFGGILRFDPAKPDWAGRDRFIMSKGHAAPILYAALAERGVFSTDRLMDLRKIGSELEGHPNRRRLAGVEASTGSLGQGLSIGLGMALAARLGGEPYRAFVLCGDGELNEGQVWEAAMAASKYRTGNLICIVDRNEMQQTGASDKVLPLDPLVPKWEACGWNATEIDGHDWDQVLSSLERAVQSDGKPSVIVARTRKGYGVSRILADPVNQMHGVPLKAENLEEAIQEVLSA